MVGYVKEGFFLTKATSRVILTPFWDHTVETDEANIVRTWEEQNTGRVCTHEDVGRGMRHDSKPFACSYHLRDCLLITGEAGKCWKTHKLLLNRNCPCS